MIRHILPLVPLGLLAACASQPSDRALLDSISLRENQVPSIWTGPQQFRKIDATSTWVSGGEALRYLDSPNNRTFYDLSMRAQHDPYFPLPLLSSNDPEIVLTGLYLVDMWWNPGGWKPAAPEILSAVTGALREHCCSSADVRLRWKAYTIMADKFPTALTVADLDAVMSDLDQSIRDMSPQFASHAIGNMPAQDAVAFRQQKSAFIDVLIKHLADEDWVTRQEAMRLLRDGPLKTEGADHDRWRAVTKDLPRPNAVVYAQADWHTRQSTQKAWQDWWQSHRETLLAASD